MKQYSPAWVLALFILLLPLTAAAQADTTKMMRVVLIDGSELTGTVRSQDSSRVEFRTSSGVEMTLQRSQIRSSAAAEGTWRGRDFLKADPNRTRLFFAPTGRTLPRNNGYFSAYEVFFPMLAVGVTDYLTLAGGMSLFPGASEQIVYLAPKLRAVQLNDIDLSAGVLYLSLVEERFGIAYGVASFGPSSSALTAGIGWGFLNGEFSSKPVIMVGGEFQLSNAAKFITENWFPSGRDGIISFGIRFFGDKVAGDFALMRSTKSTSGPGFPFIPWIGFAYNF